MSGRLKQSPPEKTNTIGPNSRRRRIIAFASSVVSSPLSRRGCAMARQCWQARSQAWVVSQIAMNGAESKSRFRRDGALCG